MKWSSRVRQPYAGKFICVLSCRTQDVDRLRDLPSHGLGCERDIAVYSNWLGSESMIRSFRPIPRAQPS